MHCWNFDQSAVMSLAPSLGVATAIRADIITALKSRGSPEEMMTIISPSLTVINQWATQIPFLISVPPALDLLFAMRKDLFNGPTFVVSSFGIPLVDLPEPFRTFSTLIRDVITAQKADKPPSKVRSLYFLIFPIVKWFLQPVKRPRLIKSKATVDDDEVEFILPPPDVPDGTTDDQVCFQIARHAQKLIFLLQSMVLDEAEPVVQPSTPVPIVIQDPVLKNQRAKEAVKRVSLLQIS